MTKRWILNRHAMKEKWNNFKSADMKFFENMRLNEYKTLFNKEFNDDIALKSTINNNKNSNSFMNNANLKASRSNQKASSPTLIQKNSGILQKSNEKILTSIGFFSNILVI